MNSCSKTANTINNGSVITAPYSLYFTDTAGTLFKSNDGKTVSTVVTPDGLYARAIFNYGDNLFWIKSGIQWSTNDGRNFNHCYDSIPSIWSATKAGRVFNLNQTMVLPLPNSKIIYVVSNSPSPINYLGIAWNQVDGRPGYWYPEGNYDTIGVILTSPFKATTLTSTQNGAIYAYDAISNRILYSTSFGARWKEPIYGNKLPTTGFFFLGHYQNTLLAYDNTGNNGIWYSLDTGANWTQCTGIPANVPVNCVVSPFESICLAGTDSNGLYQFNPATYSFSQVTTSIIGANAIVRNIVGKQNVYKNGESRNYIYLSTNTGIYQSSDMGKTYVKSIPGNFVALY